MAEKQAAEAVEESARKEVGPIGAFFRGVGKVVEAVLKDGYLEASFRQGVGEFYQALKAFPDTIQVEEPGTFFNPTQGEIGKARENSSVGPPRPWPSEIAAENRHQPVNDNGNSNSKGNENDAGYSM